MKKYLLIIIGTLLFIIFLLNIGLENITGTFQTVNLIYLLPIVLLNVIVLLLKTWRWKLLLEKQNIKLEFKERFNSVSAGFFLGLVTPGTVGELGRALSTDIDRTKSFGTVVFEKFFDLISLFYITAASLLLYFLEFTFALIILTILSGLISVVTYLLIKQESIKNFIKNKLRNKNITKTFEIFISLLAQKELIVISSLVSFCLWAVTGLQFYLILNLLNISSSFSMVMVCCFVPYLASVLSFIPLGLGVLDFSMSGLFTTLFRFSNPTAYAVTLLFRLSTTLPLVVWGYSVYLYNSISRARLHQNYATDISVQKKN